MRDQIELEKLIIEKNTQYREGKPTITDPEYDFLIQELKINYPTSYLLKKAILEEAPISRKEKLPIPMYSLEQVSTMEELRQWIRKNHLENELVVLTPKLDGNSICTFEDILGLKAWTRGDGEFGQNCNEHFKIIKGTGSCTNDILDILKCYYGEAMISKDNFSKVKETHFKYKNTRNGIAGLLRRDEVSEALKFADYIRYGVENIKEEYFYSKIEQLELCNKFNKVSIPHQLFLGNNCLEENFGDFIEKTYKYWKEIFGFDIDGLVIDINSKDVRKQLGKEINKNPAYSRKIKFGWEEIKETEIIRIRWQVSKDGRLKPIAEIKPVDLAGGTVTNAQVYNAKWVYDKGLGGGVKIKIRRSGEIIPEIVEVINPIKNVLTIASRTINELIEQNIITSGEQITWDENQVNYILKKRTDEWLIQEMVFFFETMKLENFGEPSIRKLFNVGYRSIKHILELTNEQIMVIDGFGEITAKYLIEYFKKWKEEGVELFRYAAALNCFKGLGVKLLSQIPREYFFKGDWTYRNLEGIEGFKETRINAFIDGYKIWKYYFENLPIKVKEEEKEIATALIDEKFKGYKICFTQFRDKDLEQKIFAHCGEIVDGISKNTTHLVIKEKGKNTSKEAKALKLGINIITKEELEKIIS